MVRGEEAGEMMVSHTGLSLVNKKASDWLTVAGDEGGCGGEVIMMIIIPLILHWMIFLFSFLLTARLT